MPINGEPLCAEMPLGALARATTHALTQAHVAIAVVTELGVPSLTSPAGELSATRAPP